MLQRSPDAAGAGSLLGLERQGAAEGIVTQLYKSSEGAVHTNTAAEFARRQKACIVGKAAQATSAVDAAETIKRTYTEFKDRPFSIDCRAFAKNTVITAGKTVDECMAVCDTKYGGGWVTAQRHTNGDNVMI